MKTYNSILMYFLLTLIGFAGVACSDDDATAGKYPAPTISGFSPSEGLPTQIVTITGTEFGSERTERIGRVYFGGVEAREYVSWSDTEIKVRVPEGGKTGFIGLWIWKNSTETTEQFTCLPGAKITGVSDTFVAVGSTLSFMGQGFDYFIEKGITRDDIVVSFPSAEGTVQGEVIEFTANRVDVVVPAGARGGKPTLQFGEFQIVTAPNVDVTGYFNYYLTHLNVVELTGKCNPCSYAQPQGGKPTIYEYKNGIGYGEGFDETSEVVSFTLWDCAVGDMTLFKVNILEENDYYLYFGTKAKGTGNIKFSFGTDPENLTETITAECSANGYGWPDYEYEIGKFHLMPGENYLRVDFVSIGLALTDMHITNERVTEGNIIVPEIPEQVVPGLFAHDFDDNTLGLFTPQWSWEPSYAKAVNGYMEVHFDQAALDADNRRERRGAEVVCDFKTTSEGWYGFKIFLPEGEYPKNVEGSCIAQIFNAGNANTWAGHLKVNNEDLTVHYRGSAAASAEVTKTVGKLTWDKWIPVVLYFKAGRNNKGNIKVWMGDDIYEANPTFDSGAINFAFGNWIDDNTLDDKDNGDYKGASLGGKWGLYVATGGDRTIRFDDLKILQGNPTNAFLTVKPGN